MRATSLIMLLSTLQLAMAAPSVAGSFQATPVNVEMRAPGSTSTVALKNDGDAAMNVQVRVFRWSQVDGKDSLVPTTDLVASPPMTAIAARSEQTIRLVRVVKSAIAAEETYRIFVDEIPDPAKQKAGQIAVALRYSIPVFIMPSEPTQPQLAWSIRQADGATYVSATNTGSRRVKISGLQLKDANGASVVIGEGLNGYVLARSSMRWVLPPKAPKMGLTGPVVVSARGDDGPINAQATPAQ